MEIFDTVRVSVVDYDHRGKGIGKSEGVVVFLDGGEIGDVVDVRILKKKKRFLEGTIEKYIQKSSDRVLNPCSYTSCNGCAFLSLSRKKELAWKRERVKNALVRIGGIDVAVAEVITAGDPFGYRNHMQFHVEERKLCLYGKDGERVPIRQCLMQTKRANDLLMKLQGQKWLDAVNLIGIRTSRLGESMLIVVGEKEISERLLQGVVAFGVDNHIDSLYYSKNSNPRFHYGKHFQHLYGKKSITETLEDYTYNIAAGNFFQINPYGAEAMIKEVTSNIAHADKIVELYSGIGTMTLSISSFADEVIGNEISPSSVDYAREVAAANGVENVRYIAGAAEEMMPKIQAERAIDAIVVDPPRAGLDDLVIQGMLETLPKQIIYISCNPSTLARDLRQLSEKYRIEKVQPVDMFPHTASIECVVLMSRVAPVE